jgi:hypothetical protein
MIARLTVRTSRAGLRLGSPSCLADRWRKSQSMEIAEASSRRSSPRSQPWDSRSTRLGVVPRAVKGYNPGLKSARGPVRIGLAGSAVDFDSPWLRHRTHHRTLLLHHVITNMRCFLLDNTSYPRTTNRRRVRRVLEPVGSTGSRTVNWLPCANSRIGAWPQHRRYCPGPSGIEHIMDGTGMVSITGDPRPITAKEPVLT